MKTLYNATRQLGRVHTDHFTRRAYRSRTVRVGLPVYTLRPLRRVRPVHSDHIRMCSQWTRTVPSAWLCSVNARVDASGASGRGRRTVCACLQTDLFISTDTIDMTRKGAICHELSTCNLVTTVTKQTQCVHGEVGADRSRRVSRL